MLAETSGTELLSGKSVTLGEPLRLKGWEFSIIES